MNGELDRDYCVGASLDSLPVSAADIRAATAVDPIWSVVLAYVING